MWPSQNCRQGRQQGRRAGRQAGSTLPGKAGKSDPPRSLAPRSLLSKASAGLGKGWRAGGPRSPPTHPHTPPTHRPPTPHPPPGPHRRQDVDEVSIRHGLRVCGGEVAGDAVLVAHLRTRRGTGRRRRERSVRHRGPASTPPDGGGKAFRLQPWTAHGLGRSAQSGALAEEEQGARHAHATATPPACIRAIRIRCAPPTRQRPPRRLPLSSANPPFRAPAAPGPTWPSVCRVAGSTR